MLPHGRFTVLICIGPSLILLYYLLAARQADLFVTRSPLRNLSRLTGCDTRYLEGKTKLYVITATFPRLTQVAELTRLGHTLKQVNNLLWIVCDDAPEKNPRIQSLLRRLDVPHEYYISPMPEEYRSAKALPRGVANRNRALHRLMREDVGGSGVFYFADDDNTYDLELFCEIRNTRRLSVFPVGLVTETQLSTPVVKEGKVVGFYDGWIGPRKFPVDMAGFAVNLGFYAKMVEKAALPVIPMPFRAGFEEDGFLKSLNVSWSDLQPLANNCTKILVWHTRTSPPGAYSPKQSILNDYPGTNLQVLHEYLSNSTRLKLATNKKSL